MVWHDFEFGYLAVVFSADLPDDLFESGVDAICDDRTSVLGAPDDVVGTAVGYIVV